VLTGAMTSVELSWQSVWVGGGEGGPRTGLPGIA
jgi:hypothetical protein